MNIKGAPVFKLMSNMMRRLKALPKWIVSITGVLVMCLCTRRYASERCHDNYGDNDSKIPPIDGDHVPYRMDSHIVDTRKIMETRDREMESRDTRRANDMGVIPSTGLEYPLLMRTDDERTKQTAPWGLLPGGCSTKHYGDMRELGKVSVIICFHENENLADVLHTVHSIVQRTPSHILQEVLLIDDNSKKEDFRQILDQYIGAIFSNNIVRIIRSDTKLGLIQCRLHGAHQAQGDVIYFMDSHMEVQPRWLEPLLWEIKLNPLTMATSYLDWMQRDVNGSWSYRHGASSWKTYFDWNFVFGFQVTSHLAKSPDMTSPVSCPVTVGGVFAISRKFFLDIGGFDEGMWGWGGENLDLPIRVWLFGGRVVNVPCSHVGHMENPGHRSYRASWTPRIHQNYKRVTEVWLGDYKKYFYYYNPSFTSIDPGNLTARLEVKKRAPRTFAWILDNIFPELGLYDNDSFAWEGLRNVHFNRCLCAMAPQTDPVLRTCNINDTSTQTFFLNGRGELRFPVHIFNAKGDNLRINEYIGQYQTETPTKWIPWPGGPLRKYSSNECLEAVDLYSVMMKPCDSDTPSQRWRFHTYSDKLSDLVQSKPGANSDHYLYTLYRQYLEEHGNTPPGVGV